MGSNDKQQLSITAPAEGRTYTALGAGGEITLAVDGQIATDPEPGTGSLDFGSLTDLFGSQS
ncbi:hypothetical protein ABEU20_000681 [Rhodococcus sp. PAM 2766]|uniref:Uncharacterized protein n=1 Tax=Rhodococcus parequi TaxID=3137122 RepID=A0ABW9FAL6_9NOCA